jgi:hypothetical protein
MESELLDRLHYQEKEVGALNRIKWNRVIVGTTHIRTRHSLIWGANPYIMTFWRCQVKFPHTLGECDAVQTTHQVTTAKLLQDGTDSPCSLDKNLPSGTVKERNINRKKRIYHSPIPQGLLRLHSMNTHHLALQSYMMERMSLLMK